LENTQFSEFGHLKIRVQVIDPNQVQELIKWAQETHQMIGFQEYVPSMHQIFVDQVKTA
jgi:ABC-type uncharacterized transport system ATPase subunit